MYSRQALTHFTNPCHAGDLENASAVEQAGTPRQGPVLVTRLRIEGEAILEARFQTYGCPAAIASGNWVSAWVRGKTLTVARGRTPEQVIEGIGGLPPGKDPCPTRAVEALQNALELLETKGAGP